MSAATAGLLASLALALAAGCGAAYDADAGVCAGERERAMRLASHIEQTWPLRRDDAITAYVAQLGNQLVAVTPGRKPEHFEFRVVRHRGGRAYSIGDGRVYVSDGAITLLETEGELASILAHEIGHQVRGHFCAPARGAGAWEGGVEVQVDPRSELEADELAIELLARAGYAPQNALTAALRVRSDAENGSKHLVDSRRIDALRLLVEEAPEAPVRESAAFRVVKQQLADEARSVSRKR